MEYISTRGRSPAVDSAQAVLDGLATDGGLYLPAHLPEFDWQGCLACSPREMSARILTALLPDIPNIPELVDSAYLGKFSTEELTPTLPVGDFTVLELFHGPTSAFKDVALCLLPRLLTAARRQKGMTEDVVILTATSGDTGKAALAGFQDVPGVQICVFYPHGGVSQVQRAQMVTQTGSNVHVAAIRGNFDDAQTGVKEIFARQEALSFPLSSANSINIGRLAPQIMYYFKAYRDLLDRGTIQMGEQVNFSVPTGNFGDILAGFLAKEMGLPVGRLICASNANNVLTDFIRTGTYDRRRPLKKTTSPSMDILVSSNLERLLYLITGDAGQVRRWMEELAGEGHYTLSPPVLSAIQELFWAGYCDDNQAARTIGRVFHHHQYLCDPHTAAGWAVAEDYVRETGDGRPMVVLSTASPFKFPEAVLSAIGGDPTGDGFCQMRTLSALAHIPIPENLALLPTLPERHNAVIGRDDMLDFVRERIKN